MLLDCAVKFAVTATDNDGINKTIIKIDAATDRALESSISVYLYYDATESSLETHEVGLRVFAWSVLEGLHHPTSVIHCEGTRLVGASGGLSGERECPRG